MASPADGTKKEFSSQLECKKSTTWGKTEFTRRNVQHKVNGGMSHACTIHRDLREHLLSCWCDRPESQGPKRLQCQKCFSENTPRSHRQIRMFLVCSLQASSPGFHSIQQKNAEKTHSGNTLYNRTTLRVRGKRVANSSPAWENWWLSETQFQHKKFWKGCGCRSVPRPWV